MAMLHFQIISHSESACPRKEQRIESKRVPNLMTAHLNYSDAGKENIIECGALLTIGRSKTNDVVLSDVKVSRNHSLIRRLSSDQYYVMDEGSANGTLLKGERVVTPAALSDGDKIIIGSTEFIFHQDTDSPVDEWGDDTAQTMTATVSIAPSIRQVVVLFADIRGYTKLSERIPIALLAKLLGRWFKCANDIIERSSGIVDKFIGDAVMARWLVDETGPFKSSMRALRAAEALSRATEDLINEFPEIGDPLRIGVGINTGRAAVDVRAAGRVQDYTVLGDVVNVAFRLEGATKELGKDVVVSMEAVEKLSQNLWKDRECGVQVKGKKDPIHVCALTFDELADFLESEGLRLDYPGPGAPSGPRTKVD